ncbi:type II CAAX endopeptidase family protein [Neobacillus sp. PS3-12]|uniref:CPBP family intramembrane glutamic endopeptidase n=1 Tax=Neobacillus sp. PS3-12 TaxID=3070677 RepID=UPI0027E20852|nr:type II CAAX endopeptidase family protein [Neobacillus sp. PS3-12]WML51694.1 type II CAAX endopeptidase family protein [Neobacillus sp. PS3-12]
METKLSVESEAKIYRVRTLILYLLGFYFVWALKELWIINYFQLFGGTTYALLNALAKVLVWIVPIWIYVKYYLNINPMNYFNMNINVKKGLIWGVILSLLVGLYYTIVVYLVNHRTFHFLLPLDDYLDEFLVVGITEEMVFRGLILKEISNRMSFWKANVMTSLLFLLIHYPIWIHHGEFFNFWNHPYIFLIGLIFGFIYKKTGSLWSVVLLHSFYDLFVNMM